MKTARDPRTADGGSALAAAGGPAVVGANWYRFGPGQRIRHDRVDGVTFLWAVQGSGEVASCGRTFRLDTTVVLRLPWGHDVEYRADARAPFSIGTLHLLPWHDLSLPVEPRVAHVADDPLIGVPYRRGEDQPGIPWLGPATAAAARELITLGTYCIDRFLGAPPPSEPVLRALGVLVAEGSARWDDDSASGSVVPAALETMIEYLRSNLARPLSIAEVAASADCSVATAQRLFSRYTGLSVLAWLRRRRMDEAALLLRTTSLRVNEVARLVGYPDPLYFSRVFASVHGLPPSRYAVDRLRP